MKNIRKAVIFTLLLTVAFFATVPAAPLFAAEPSAQPAFENSRAWTKLDSRTQQAWLAAKKAGDMGRRLDCFVRVQYPGGQGDEDFLVSAGYVVRVFSGSVATGHLAAGNMQRVAELPFVQTIKLSSK